MNYRHRIEGRYFLVAILSLNCSQPRLLPTALPGSSRL